MLLLALGIFQALRFEADGISSEAKESHNKRYRVIVDNILTRVQDLEPANRTRQFGRRGLIDAHDVVRLVRECLLYRMNCAERVGLPALKLHFGPSYQKIEPWKYTELGTALTGSWELGQTGHFDEVINRLAAHATRFQSLDAGAINANNRLFRSWESDPTKILDLDINSGMCNILRMRAAALLVRVIVDGGKVKSLALREIEQAIAAADARFKARRPEASKAWPHGLANYSVVKALYHYVRGSKHRAKNACVEELQAAEAQFAYCHDFFRASHIRTIIDKMPAIDHNDVRSLVFNE